MKRSVRLQDLDFDREQLKVVQGVKRPLRSLIKTFNSRTQTYIAAEKPKRISSTDNPKA
jgi:hypothetical protein